MSNKNTFEELTAGQSFEELCQTLGNPTEHISSEVAQIEPGITGGVLNSELYEWFFDSGDSIRVLFKQNKLNDKVYFPKDSV